MNCWSDGLTDANCSTALISRAATELKLEIRKWKIENGNPRLTNSAIFKFRFSNFQPGSVADAALGGLIAFARVDQGLLFLAFLVQDRQWAAIRSDQLHFDFVKFAVLCAARG